MTRFHLLSICTIIFAGSALTMTSTTSIAQGHGHAPSDQEQQEQATASHDEKHVSVIGDPYTLETCPISGMNLGSMGDPVVKTIAGREVRFCCDACAERFEADTRSQFEKIDEQMIEDQKPHYPLDNCIVTGMKLGSMGDPFDHMHRNRLVRFCCAGCVEPFESETTKYLETLDSAVIETQKPDYKLDDTCVVSAEDVRDQGEAVELVFANRLVRFCCTGCVLDFNKNPARYLNAIADGKAVGNAAHDHDHVHDHGGHDGHDGHDGHGDHGCGGRGGSGGAGSRGNHGRDAQPRPRRGGCGRRS